MYEVRGARYSYEEIEAFVRDSVADGICSACGEVNPCVEPDAMGYDCEVCGAEGTVDSVLVCLGMI